MIYLFRNFQFFDTYFPAIKKNGGTLNGGKSKTVDTLFLCLNMIKLHHDNPHTFSSTFD